MCDAITPIQAVGLVVVAILSPKAWHDVALDAVKQRTGYGPGMESDDSDEE